jgi:hypothetical protein
MQRNTKIILSVIVGVFLLIMLAIGGVVWVGWNAARSVKPRAGRRANP